jgi:hypothetical protein
VVPGDPLVASTEHADDLTFGSYNLTSASISPTARCGEVMGSQRHPGGSWATEWPSP